METKERGAQLTPEEEIILARKQAEAAIIARAWQDDVFRTQLLEDPKAALASTGVQLPDHVQISVRQETAATWELVLPTKPTRSMELCDADLEQVAGAAYLWDGKCKVIDEIKRRLQEKQKKSDWSKQDFEDMVQVGLWGFGIAVGGSWLWE